LIGTDYRHTEWDISFLADNETLRAKNFGMTREAKSVQYPIRLLRYWFGYHLLRAETERAGRPLDVAEIGVDVGQMLMFADAVKARDKSAKKPLEWASWTAIDAVLKLEKLKKVGYADFVEANLENPAFALDRDYDFAILLHVLEHLFEPEEALAKIARHIRPGGAIIGGFPVLPDFLVQSRQAAVRKTAKPMGHVSVFSPERVIRMAAQCGLQTEFLTGAFLMRSKGNPIENSPGWMKFNLRWGKTFPWWPGETYWLLRKPE